jgi:two-component system, chemotaxis family, response regulator PixG
MKSAPFNFATQYEELLNQIKRQRLDGKLIFEGSAPQKHWSLYFHLGRLIYATGGAHPVRRFHRHIKVALPTFEFDKASQVLAKSSLADIQKISWDYELLRLWRDQALITRDQAQQIANSCLQEIILDIMQSGRRSEIVPCDLGFKSLFLALNDPIPFVSSVHPIWQRWEQANLVPYNFDDAPMILKPEELRQKTSEGVYSSLSKLLNGEHTLRDLATLRKRDVVDITTSIYPYLKETFITLKPIPDRPMPKVVTDMLATLVQSKESRTKPPELPTPTKGNKPLIACVDDSPLVCQTMERIFRGAGYSYLGIQDSLRAVPQLLIHKPALIFLDLVMPSTNGYEVCSQLRKTSIFKETPIVILTGNDGIVDRVRAKVVGATDFLGKPVDGETVLAVTEQCLSAVKS